MTILTEELIRNMIEDDLRTKVIGPLFERLGYRDVHVWHGGPNEFGKDLVCWKEEAASNRVYTAIVAKAKRIVGPASYSEVARQIHQAFNKGYEDPISMEHHQVHRVWVVTNKVLTKDNREQVASEINPPWGRYVSFLDGDQLWELVQRFLPIAPFPAYDEAQKRMKLIDHGFDTQVVLGSVQRPFARLSTTDRQVFLGERYPGQLDQEPLTMSGRFEFPDTPEAREKLREYEEALNTGTSVDIPGEYVRFDSPPWLDAAVSHHLGISPEEITSFHLSSGPSSQRLPLLVEFTPDDGELVPPLYADLTVTQSGRVETTLTNDHQQIPIYVKLVINFNDNTVNFTCTRKKCPIAAPIMLHLLQMTACLNKPGQVRLSSLETGMSHGRLRIVADGQPPTRSDLWYLVADLAAIQEHLEQLILIPVEPITAEELHTIALLKSIIEQPEREGEWNSATTTCYARDLDSALTMFANAPRPFRFKQERSLQLFGQEIALGNAEEVLESVSVVNEEEARKAATEADSELAEIVIRLAPESDNRVMIRFLDWLPDVSEVDQNPA